MLKILLILYKLGETIDYQKLNEFSLTNIIKFEVDIMFANKFVYSSPKY